MNTLCLKIFNDDDDIQVQVHTDASDFAAGAVLLQKENDSFRPVTYYSRRLNPAQMNYVIHEKETLAIISVLDQWSVYLKNGILFTIVTDHESLQYLNTQPKLSRRQARWMEQLSEYNY